jgi:hypothetical protein
MSTHRQGVQVVILQHREVVIVTQHRVGVTKVVPHKSEVTTVVLPTTVVVEQVEVTVVVLQVVEATTVVVEQVGVQVVLLREVVTVEDHRQVEVQVEGDKNKKGRLILPFLSDYGFEKLSSLFIYPFKCVSFKY